MQKFLDKLGIRPKDKTLSINLSAATLIERSVALGVGRLSEDGALVVHTGMHTGRAAKDKYIVMNGETKEKIWWNKDLREMSEDIFDKIKKTVTQHFNQAPELFISERSAGADSDFNLGIRVISTSPSHILFSQYLFREKIKEWGAEDFTILHAPNLVLNPEKYDTRSGTVITTHFGEKLVLIVGTLYAGEIKKSIFSIMNYLLPDKGILPMHSGANIGQNKDVSIFFGLSGTGKTTLSTDEGRRLIGDDEHGLSEKGVFNFEGGCYAKTYKLSQESEPEIYQACRRFGTILENVVIAHDTRKVDFFDKSLAENTRASYPLSFIDGFVESSQGPIPQHMFFLSADAFGVLPPVAKLTKAQAMYYFLSGYTARVAGTEMGVEAPSAVFSTCFGAPFMPQKPLVYGKLLGQLLDKLNIQVWLINTGWTGGGHDVGRRFPIKVTRTIIRAIQNQKLQQITTTPDKIFGLHVPNSIPGVETDLLNPRQTWKDKEAYDKTAQNLAMMFHNNIKNFDSLSESILSGGPLYRG